MVLFWLIYIASLIGGFTFLSLNTMKWLTIIYLVIVVLGSIVKGYDDWKEKQ